MIIIEEESPAYHEGPKNFAFYKSTGHIVEFKGYFLKTWLPFAGIEDNGVIVKYGTVKYGSNRVLEKQPDSKHITNYQAWMYDILCEYCKTLTTNSINTENANEILSIIKNKIVNYDYKKEIRITEPITNLLEITPNNHDIIRNTITKVGEEIEKLFIIVNFMSKYCLTQEQFLLSCIMCEKYNSDNNFWNNPFFSTFTHFIKENYIENTEFILKPIQTFHNENNVFHDNKDDIDRLKEKFSEYGIGIEIENDDAKIPVISDEIKKRIHLHNIYNDLNGLPTILTNKKRQLDALIKMTQSLKKQGKTGGRKRTKKHTKKHRNKYTNKKTKKSRKTKK
jgi:hypothetical protein